jgi:hypothetical protein
MILRKTAFINVLNHYSEYLFVYVIAKNNASSLMDFWSRYSCHNFSVQTFDGVWEKLNCLLFLANFSRHLRIKDSSTAVEKSAAQITKHKEKLKRLCITFATPLKSSDSGKMKASEQNFCAPSLQNRQNSFNWAKRKYILMLQCCNKQSKCNYFCH